MTDSAEQAKKMEAGDPRRIAASIAMVDSLTEHWSLRGDEKDTLLGGIAKSTRSGPWALGLGTDVRERIANLFAIDMSAHSLFAPEFADQWVRSPNAAFGGNSPLSVMLRGNVEDIVVIRRYLENIRKGNGTIDVSEVYFADGQ